MTRPPGERPVRRKAKGSADPFDTRGSGCGPRYSRSSVLNKYANTYTAHIISTLLALVLVTAQPELVKPEPDEPPPVSCDETFDEWRARRGY